MIIAINILYILIGVSSSYGLEPELLRKLQSAVGQYEVKRGGEECMSGLLELKEYEDGHALLLSGIPFVVEIGATNSEAEPQASPDEDCSDSVNTKVKGEWIEYDSTVKCKSSQIEVRVERKVQVLAGEIQYMQVTTRPKAKPSRLICVLKKAANSK